jgi:hypothetical protein
MVRARWRAAGDSVRAHLGTIGNLSYRAWTADWSERSRPLSRLLVLLTTLLLLVMPITEHLCNWDHFLRGGPDVEFSLLAGLLFAAMVVLSMNGTMLQPRMLQPERMQPVAAGNGGFESRTAAHPYRHLSGSSRWCAAGPEDFISAAMSRTLVPMRI